MMANVNRCTGAAFRIPPRTIGRRRASSTTNGVASAHGNQDTNSIANGGNHGLPLPTACITTIVWLASHSAPADQIAAIQVHRVGSVSARVPVMLRRLHQSRCENQTLQRTVDSVQRAVRARALAGA